MPAARTRKHTSDPHASRSANATTSGIPAPEVEVIVISSDDESPAPKKALPKKTRRNAKQKGKAPTPAPADTVVLNISDNDATASPKASSSAQSTIDSLRKQLKAAQAEITRMKADASSHQKENQGGIAAELDDYISCEICTLRLWTPYVLPCGHTFCDTCLMDWFGTIQAKHMKANPGLFHLPLNISTIASHTPQYTCPSCRSPVKTKPVEVFAMKHIVRTIAAASGETSPKKSLPHRRMRSGPTARRAESIWDGFFPPAGC